MKRRHDISTPLNSFWRFIDPWSVYYDQKNLCILLGILWDSIHVTSTIIEVIIAVKCSFLEIFKFSTQQE